MINEYLLNNKELILSILLILLSVFLDDILVKKYDKMVVIFGSRKIASKKQAFFWYIVELLIIVQLINHFFRNFLEVQFTDHPILTIIVVVLAFWIRFNWIIYGTLGLKELLIYIKKLLRING